MKFSFKVCICTTLVIAIVCSAGSYALIANSFDADIQREVKRGLEEYQLTQFAFKSSLLTAEMQYTHITDAMLKSIIKQTASMTSGQNLAVFNGSGAKFASVPDAFAVSLPVASIGEYEQQYQVSQIAGAYILEIAGSLVYNQEKYILAVSRDIDELFAKRRDLVRFFICLDLFMIILGVFMMSGLSFVLTRPIRQLKKSAKRIANGRYHERANIRTKDEIGDLSNSFNHMAEAVEQNITDLRKYAQQQQDFVANFSHELKTPLTSIIGYADLLRSEELEPKDTFKAASFIFSEGKRLEAMSLKLLDMIVLEHQDFVLKPINIRQLLRHTSEVVSPVLVQSNIKIELIAEKKVVYCEPDLLMTLIINLIDNSRKASDGGRILLSGKTDGQQYRISVQDFGSGIAPEELHRITEAFYRVDKARARAEHSAGLGLSIAARIAKIHGSELTFESVLHEGTTATFFLPLLQDTEKEVQAVQSS